MTTLTMRRLQLEKCSIGAITTKNRIICTIERPWIPVNGARGGKPFESCIPYGKYRITEFESEKYGKVWALSNPKLGVFVNKSSRHFDTDRYACLIHAGNWVEDVVGCVAVGQGLSYDDTIDKYMVAKSVRAVRELREFMHEYEYLEILPYEESLHR
jgi:hypothetical protein